MIVDNATQMSFAKKGGFAHQPFHTRKVLPRGWASDVQGFWCDIKQVGAIMSPLCHIAHHK